MMSAKIRIAVPGLANETTNYFHALTMLGAEPVLLEQATADGFDGLLLPGGVDVAPHYYGEEPNGCGETNEALDKLQFASAEAFYAARKPILGICKGSQLLNVFFGGTLIQHLPTSAAHTRLPGTKIDNLHPTTAEEGSILFRLYGRSFTTNSAHHQAVKALGEGLVITQHAEDGTVEAFEHVSAPVFAVQWHPERLSFELRREGAVDGSLVLSHLLSLC